MKIITTTISLLLSIASIHAQLIKVANIEQINIPKNVELTSVAGISPGGDFLLLTSPSKKGLVKLSLDTKQSLTITDADGAGHNPQITADGENIIYRERSINDNHLLYTAINRYNTATGDVEQLVAPSRDINTVTTHHNTAITVSDGKMRVRSLNNEPVQATQPVIANDNNLNLLLTVNGETKSFNPQGDDQRYIWASISPNGKRVLYYVTGEGCFSCRLDQSDMISLGQIRAPKWLNDDIIIGMNDQDNGLFTTSSTIVAKSLDGREQVLTDHELIAMYPYCDADGSKIVFSTPAGEAYIINILK